MNPLAAQRRNHLLANMKLKWTVLLFIGVSFAVVLMLKAAPGLPVATAREHLKQGALLVDVRTVEEFNTKHLTNAVNIPLDEIKEALPRRVPDKSQFLLLHCRSGRRSGIAEQELRALGYTNAFNVGTYEQAEEIVKGGSK
jgi:phage shock protein E